jgi:TonB family protein
LQKESTYDLLKRWLSGEVGYKEEQQLNKHAQSDPFLADALDGYHSMPEAEHEGKIKALKAHLQEQHPTRKGRGYWMRIAASVLVLIVAAVAFWIANQTTEGQITQNEVTLDAAPGQQKKEAITELDETPPEAAEEVAIEATSPAAEEKAGPPTKPPAPARPRKIIIADDTPSNTVDQQAPIAMLEEEEMAEAKSLQADTYDNKGQAPPQKASPPEAYDRQVDVIDLQPETAETVPPPPPASQAVISGKVLDANSAGPLVGASIYIKGTKQGTITDMDGNFILPVSADTNVLELVVAYTGYAERLVKTKAGEEIQVWMDDAGVALSEVTVTSRSRFKRHKQQKAVEIAPKKGFDKYETYINKHLNYPQAAKDAGISGSVVLSFYIADNGRPRDIQVKKSLGYGCDAEAIRLLKEGPKWKGKGEQGEYTIYFEL